MERESTKPIISINHNCISVTGDPSPGYYAHKMTMKWIHAVLYLLSVNVLQIKFVEFTQQEMIPLPTPILTTIIFMSSGLWTLVCSMDTFYSKVQWRIYT